MQGETYQCYLDCIQEFLDQGKVEAHWRDLIHGGVPVVATLTPIAKVATPNFEDDPEPDVSKNYGNFETETALAVSEDRSRVLANSPDKRRQRRKSTVRRGNSPNREKNGSEVVVTIKNYQAKGGLATRIFDETAEGKNLVLTVQGPMGVGLDIQRTGTHIAFTGGTGCLVFVDLVAHLALKCMHLLSEKEDAQLDSQTFKLVLFVSFPKKDEVIGLELYEKLVELQKKLGLSIFEFHMRLSNEKPARWDHKFIRNQLEAYQTNLKRIWACGPPRMNEDFDKALEKLVPLFGLKNTDYDVL